MKRSKFAAVLLLSVLASAFFWRDACAETSVYVHFFVVPESVKEGKKLADELAELREKLVSLAGGYTELGPSKGGSKEPDGRLDTESNIAFIVSAPRNITADLEEYISRHFATKHPFILVWQAARNF
jgi:hypothetical protein